MVKIAFLASVLWTLLGAATCFADDVKFGFLSGRWLTQGNVPVDGGQVLLFNQAAGPPPSIDGYLRVPDIVGEIGSDGHFSLQAAAGKYYLVVMKRLSGVQMGPPKDGDWYFFSTAENGAPKTHFVRTGEKTDVGTISKVLIVKRGEMKPAEGTATIEGKVTDEAGNPVSGVRVLSYVTPEMQGRPLYVSEPTAKDGTYLLRVYKGGTYYLKIRSHYGGGQPETGEMMGGYGKQTAPAAVKVENGKTSKGIDIKADKFARGKRE